MWSDQFPVYSGESPVQQRMASVLNPADLCSLDFTVQRTAASPPSPSRNATTTHPGDNNSDLRRPLDTKLKLESFFQLNSTETEAPLCYPDTSNIQSQPLTVGLLSLPSEAFFLCNWSCTFTTCTNMIKQQQWNSGVTYKGTGASEPAWVTVTACLHNIHKDILCLIQLGTCTETTGVKQDTSWYNADAEDIARLLHHCAVWGNNPSVTTLFIERV